MSKRLRNRYIFRGRNHGNPDVSAAGAGGLRSATECGSAPSVRASRSGGTSGTPVAAASASIAWPARASAAISALLAISGCAHRARLAGRARGLRDRGERGLDRCAVRLARCGDLRDERRRVGGHAGEERQDRSPTATAAARARLTETQAMRVGGDLLTRSPSRVRDQPAVHAARCRRHPRAGAGAGRVPAGRPRVRRLDERPRRARAAGDLALGRAWRASSPSTPRASRPARSRGRRAHGGLCDRSPAASARRQRERGRGDRDRGARAEPELRRAVVERALNRRRSASPRGPLDARAAPRARARRRPRAETAS